MKKNFNFLCALPRTGATFLSSVINQSSQVKVSANSILPDVLMNLNETRQSSVFKNFPYHKGIDNIMLNSFEAYYKDIKVDSILDKAPWGTPYNLNMLKAVFKERKFIVLKRPVLECLASFVKIKKPENIEEYCEELMNKDVGILGKNIWSIKNLIDKKEKHIVITYDDLINDCKKQIDRIFNFLKLKKELINTDITRQYSFGNLGYADDILDVPLHTIRVGKIKKIRYKVEKYLPNKIIKRYKDIETI